MASFDQVRNVNLKSRSLVPQPKTVLPTAVRTHGLFGMPFVRQHMMVDERWTANNLTEQFKGMGDLLGRRLIFKRTETKYNHRQAVREYRNLKRQVRTGRLSLKTHLQTDSSNDVRNILINHRDMQRLYKRMPIQMVNDNINQRTFVLRKERDRLRHNLELMKKEYKEKLMESSALQNRIDYQNVYRLEEESKADEFLKLIANQKIRLAAVKTINGAFSKMLQVVNQASIFYEPILRSLNKDIEDQSNFIQTVLYMGTPLITNFKTLSEEHRKLEDKARKNIQSKLQFVANYKKDSIYRASVQFMLKQNFKPPDYKENLKRYTRETESMKFLKLELESIETTIKQVRFATLCSQAREIYPRMRTQVENNKKLEKVIIKDMLGYQNLTDRTKRADVLQGVLLNNLSEDELVRLDTIKNLQDEIQREDQFEAEILRHIKSRSNLFVLLRITLWTLSEVVHYVGKSGKPSHYSYPNSYLRLPLLKFEMLNMRSYPPEQYERNISIIMNTLKQKLGVLMKAYTTEVTPAQMAECVNEYQQNFIDMYEVDDMGDGEVRGQATEEEELDIKPIAVIPDRANIKSRSAKLIEEHIKKDE